MNRAQAKLKQRPRYVETPCPTHGPKAERYTTSKNCVQCDSEWQKRRRKEKRNGQ